MYWHSQVNRCFFSLRRRLLLTPYFNERGGPSGRNGQIFSEKTIRIREPDGMFSNSSLTSKRAYECRYGRFSRFSFVNRTFRLLQIVLVGIGWIRSGKANANDCGQDRLVKPKLNASTTRTTNEVYVRVTRMIYYYNDIYVTPRFFSINRWKTRVDREKYADFIIIYSIFFFLAEWKLIVLRPNQEVFLIRAGTGKTPLAERNTQYNGGCFLF